ncbi:STAS domain-containing protein [Tundrisphaera lichenicola]|uniref:STAS domain-containing protein n=1 Tax=Tundrisphaera lichenicola TaxID=2029860 RepID=UPI003EBACF3E
MEIKIVATTGRACGQSVEIATAKFFIGRHENCQLRPDIQGLSGIHALIEQREMRVYLRDFGGEGGTGINDRVLRARETEVFDGDLIQIGPMVLTLAIKGKGEMPRGLAHAPEGWPFLEGIAYDTSLEEPEGAEEHASRPRFEPRPTPRIPDLAALAVHAQPRPAPPPVAPTLPPPPLNFSVGAKPLLNRALSCRTIDDVLVATVNSHDLNEEETVSPVRYELRSILEEDETPRRMVIDLGNTRFLSSRAVGVILAHYQGLERKGATMRVCGVSPEIQPVLDQMRLSMLIDVYPTVEEAVKTPWD